MSTEAQDMPMATQPIAEHEWLHQLLGEWTTESEMILPNGQLQRSTGRETVTSLGGLWAVTEGQGAMPDGSTMEYRFVLGYDVSFKEYRGCWFASPSSHLWRYVGTLSDDGRTMTLECEGPDMMEEGKTALYRDVIEIIDANHRTLTSYGQDASGEWHQFVVCKLSKVVV